MSLAKVRNRNHQRFSKTRSLMAKKVSVYDKKISRRQILDTSQAGTRDGYRTMRIANKSLILPKCSLCGNTKRLATRQSRTEYASTRGDTQFITHEGPPTDFSGKSHQDLDFYATDRQCLICSNVFSLLLAL